MSAWSDGTTRESTVTPPSPRPPAAGTLFIVATPIGNLEDITLRALRILREVDLIAAEDTRRTSQLLARHGIPTPTISFHEHNTKGRLPQLIGRLTAGASIALVSDAGTPGLSDPGLELVQSCIANGLRVDPIPGPSAPLTAVVASGFPVVPLTLLGFPPPRPKDRAEWISALASTTTTVTFFEAPHRVAKTLHEIAHVLGERQIVVARELTKVHQSFLRGTAASLAPQLAAVKGELTLVVAPSSSHVSRVETPSDAEILDQFCRTPYSEANTRGERISMTAKRLGVSRRSVFDALERAKVSCK